MKQLLFIGLAALSMLLHSCSGCVRNAADRATETTLSALEGALDALDRHGEHIAGRVTDVAGTLLLGVTKSLDRQLQEHAQELSTGSHPIEVRKVDGFTEGFNEEISTYYKAVNSREELPSGLKVDFIGRYESVPVIDCYLTTTGAGKYFLKYTLNDASGKALFVREAQIEAAENTTLYWNVGLSLTTAEASELANGGSIEIKAAKL